MRESFEAHMKVLEEELMSMGGMVVKAINRSIEALKLRNIKEAESIISDDFFINKKRWDIEERCINLIATQQPVATTLRELVSLLNIITELERIGDYAEGVAKIVVMLGDKPLVKPLIDIPRMAEVATDMLERSLQAFLERRADTARAICLEDDEVDGLYEQVFRELLLLMAENPKDITVATYLIWTSHNLERIADRVTNICERTVFLVEGTMKEIKVSKY